MNAFKQTCDNCGWRRVATGGYARSEECPRCGGNSFSDTKSTPVQADKDFGEMKMLNKHIHGSAKENKPLNQEDLEERVEKLDELIGFALASTDDERNVDMIKGWEKKIKSSLKKLETAARKDELEYIRENSSGGGSWRRVIEARLKESK